jgi:hypothetical protein
MGCRVMIGKRAIAGARDDSAVAHNDAADRNFAPLAGGSGFR